ncbi:MAG: TonB-dependent receptor [Bacteroidia bacterium]|nr:TonB-dependent receptor [Bacteroidia bacterium]
MLNLFCRFSLCLFLFTGISQGLFAQTTLSGTVSETDKTKVLPGSAVVALNPNDSTIISGVASDADGHFLLSPLNPGRIILKASFLGYKTFYKEITLTAGKNEFAVILQSNATNLQGVTIEAQQIRAVQKGDTTELNAGAFKVNQDATTEDLIKKMPGITIEDGKVKAQGEEVKKVLIDGKEFFGDDVSSAVKNLPAEVVDKIQLFDKLSDQAQFTGFDDGNSRKTMNIVTKGGGLKNATFGKFYAGGGSNERYQAGAIYNRFSGTRRLTFLSQTNNINQQNFSGEDLLGLTAGTSGGMGNRMNRMMGVAPGANDPSNFMVGQQSGINLTNALGINYSDSLGKKALLTGSYFFNNSANNTLKDLDRTFFSKDTLSRNYNETSDDWSNNLNHRLNLRLEVSFDSLNSLIYTPRLSWQGNQKGSSLNGTTLEALLEQSRSATANHANNSGYSMGHNLLLRHKFKKQGRTLSLVLNTDTQEKNGENGLNSFNTSLINNGLTDTLALRQDAETYYSSRTYSGNLSYTEPLAKAIQLFVSYSPSRTIGISEKNTRDYDPASGLFTRLDTLLSNRFVKVMNTQQGGAGLRLNTKKITMMGNLRYEHLVLGGFQSYPFNQDIQVTFRNFLPMGMFNYKFSKSTNLRIFYRTSNYTPYINQLQNVVDNSNPLQLSTGNPNLRQDYSHHFNMRFGTANLESARSLFLNVGGTFTKRYIANSIFIATSDTTLPDGIRLLNGAQLSRPVNLDGYINLRSMLTYSMPIKPLRSNFNLQAGMNYAKTPGMRNGLVNETNNYGYTGGLVLASNINEKIDFTLSYNGGLNQVENSLQPQLNNKYFIQSAAAKGNWLPWKWLVINTELTYSRFDGLNNFNQEFLLWNAGVGYKFMKNQAAEIRMSAFYILGQNTRIARIVNENYIDDSRTTVLTRYFMLTFTWNLRNLAMEGEKKKLQSGNSQFGPPHGPPPHGHP